MNAVINIDLSQSSKVSCRADCRLLGRRTFRSSSSLAKAVVLLMLSSHTCAFKTGTGVLIGTLTLNILSPSKTQRRVRVIILGDDEVGVVVADDALRFNMLELSALVKLS